MVLSNKKSVSISQIMPMLCKSIEGGKSVSFKPKGTSMLPLIKQGIDSVKISPVSGKLKKYDIIFFKRDNGQYVLHRIVKIGETYTCCGDNQFENEENIRREQIIAVVSSFTYKDKWISVTNPMYKVYYILWHITRPLRKLRG